MTDHDILAIPRYTDWIENDKHVYGVRGIGKTYKQFYQWFNSTIKPIYNHSDMPWHYFTLSLEDEKKLIDLYASFIYEESGD